MAYGKKGGYGNPAPNMSHAKSSSFPGYKCLPTNRSPSRSSSGKMSSEHGTNSGNPTKGMTHAGMRIGHGSPRPRKID